jgi:carbon monoxide dehydrogenase subunit G
MDFEITEQFEVLAPPHTVWALLSDPDAVVGCVPGAAIVGRQADGSLDTTLTVKFGPLRVAFQARAVLELEPDRMHGRLTARGKDNQGGARFEANSSFDVVAHPSGNGAQVVLRAGVEISGRLAALVEGGASVVARQMSAEFARCLSAALHAV